MDTEAIAKSDEAVVAARKKTRDYMTQARSPGILTSVHKFTELTQDYRRIIIDSVTHHLIPGETGNNESDRRLQQAHRAAREQAVRATAQVVQQNINVTYESGGTPTLAQAATIIAAIGKTAAQVYGAVITECLQTLEQTPENVAARENAVEIANQVNSVLAQATNVQYLMEHAVS